MKAKIIKSIQVKENDFGAIKVREIFNTPEMESMSAAIIKLDGINKKVRNTRCNHFYFVLEGDGNFIIEGQKYEVTKGDLVFIPKGTVYLDSGKMTMLAFNHPRFNAEQVEYL